MIAMTPLEQAVVACARDRGEDNRQAQFDDAVALGETKVFSNRNIAHITGLSMETIAQLTKKKDKVGGRLNPASLSLILDLRNCWLTDSYEVRGKTMRRVNKELLHSILNLGTSYGMIARLSEIPLSTLHRVGTRRGK